jgi:hypothetical protein
MSEGRARATPSYAEGRVEAGSDRAGFFTDVLRAAAEVVQEFKAAVRSADEPAPPENPQPW